MAIYSGSASLIPLILLLMVISLPTHALTTRMTLSQPLDLATYRWQNRLVVIFSPSENHPFFRQQMALLQNQTAELQDRDLLLIQVLEEGPSQIAGQPLSQASVDHLQQTFAVAADRFRVLLIGKDGTAKRQTEQPILPQDLFTQIDSMPMRQREMRQR